MTHNPFIPMRLLIPAATMVFGSACILEMAAGPTPTAQVVVVTGDTRADSPEPALSSPTPESILTLAATMTFTPEPTSTATTAPVTMIAGQNLSCVKGPHWILYEWVAGVAEGEAVILPAKAPPEWEEYYYVRTPAGKECWVGGSSSKSSDLSSLPVREAPPLPQITLTIKKQTYLRITNLRMRPKDETVWGIHLLGAHVIDGAQTYGLTITAGFYDIY
jgi:hypothetical protein